MELSDQVQRAVGAVNLDSLFIDEGFGTLDPDTLALVSETLQGLRVGALHEIGTGTSGRRSDPPDPPKRPNAAPPLLDIALRRSYNAYDRGA